MNWPQATHFFRPRLLDSLAGYNRQRLTQDMGAGITVGVVALPLAMAFAIASGLKPEAGLFTAIIAGFLISALGGSRVQIGGPAGAFIVIVYGIVERYGLANLILATAMSGVLLFLMGLFRLGSLIRFIPVSVVIGFTNGIAVLIMLSQIKDLMGLKIQAMPADFFSMLNVLGQNLHTANLAALLVALGSLSLLVGWMRLGRRLENTPYRWVSLVVWLYFMEGVIRAHGDPWPSNAYAGLEIALCLVLFTACALHVRLRLRNAALAAAAHPEAAALDTPEAPRV